ncbi:MAG: biopolymer transporter ExbD [Pseudomonadota bacterium]
MRSRRLSHNEEPSDVNVTPLLDIVFIMLIFFIVTATFVYEDGIRPNIPQKSEDEATNPPPSMLLTVREDGFVQVDGLRLVDPKSVKPVVEEFLAKESKGVVIVSAASDASIDYTMTTLDQARLGAGPSRYGKITLTMQSTAQ